MICMMIPKCPVLLTAATQQEAEAGTLSLSNTTSFIQACHLLSAVSYSTLSAFDLSVNHATQNHRHGPYHPLLSMDHI